MPIKMSEKVRLTKILSERGLSQKQFQILIKDATGTLIGTDRISRICTGKLRTYKLETAMKISDALKLTIDSFIEDDSPIYDTKAVFENPTYFNRK
jgi:transcriptional regulator with XRE-family HTH domain